MKSIKSLAIACLLSIGTLAACGDDEVAGAVKNIKGGSKDEKQAIQYCVQNKPIAILAGGDGITLNLTDTFDATADNGDFLLLGTEQGGVEVNFSMYTVKIEWDIDTTSQYYESTESISDTQKAVYFKFPTKAADEGLYNLKIKKISCGAAVSEDPQVSYKLNVKTPVYKHVSTNLAALNKISANKIPEKAGGTEYGYDLIKYDQKSPYWVGNNGTAEKDYYYVDVNGEIIYSAPDGNWALLADGEQIMELYAGSAYNLMASHYPALARKYVKVSGNMGQYNGNIQIGFITYVKDSAASEKKTGTINYQKIDAAWLEALKTTYLGSSKAQTRDPFTVAATIAETAAENKWVDGKQYKTYKADKDGFLNISSSVDATSALYVAADSAWKLTQGEKNPSFKLAAADGFSLKGATISYKAENGAKLVRVEKDSAGKDVETEIVSGEFFALTDAKGNDVPSVNIKLVNEGSNGAIKVTGFTGELQVLTKNSELQCVPGKNLTNALVEVTGTLVPGSVTANGSKATELKKGQRGTFQLAVDDEHVITVAYDYHTDKDGSVGLCAKLNQAIQSGKAMTIKGTYRYNCSDSAPFLQDYSNPGAWQVVPFLADHCAF